MRRALVVGNWKMNGSVEDIETLLEGLEANLEDVATEVAVCPPYLYIPLVRDLLEAGVVAVGAQSCSEHKSGAFTGEVAADMLSDNGCRWVIVGHSERRALFTEGDAAILTKYCAAKASGMQPILCVGETLQEREQDQAFQVVASQLQPLLESTELDQNTVIAYEPVWAIGTGRTATSAQAEEVHEFIRGQIAAVDKNIAESVRILYGGSVKADNAAELFEQTNIDGGLIGGASLVQEKFVAIVKAAS